MANQCLNGGFTFCTPLTNGKSGTCSVYQRPNLHRTLNWPKKKSHGTALMHRRCYSFMQICITRIIRVRDTVETITAQFQSAASQCPDSVQKRNLCLAFVNAVNILLLMKKNMPPSVYRGWN